MVRPLGGLKGGPVLWLRTAAAQRARKSQVAVAIVLQSVNTKEASNANCVNERCKILRSLNRVFVFEIVLCIGAPSKDPARFVDLGFWILRNKEAQEYKSSSQETNHNVLPSSWRRQFSSSTPGNTPPLWRSTSREKFS